MNTITKLDEHSLEFAQILQTENDFQNFVDSHPEIEMLQDLRDNYPRIGRRYLNLRHSKKIGSINFKISLNDWSHINTLEDFQKFIDDNNIESSAYFKKHYGGLVNKAKGLGIKVAKDLTYHSSKPDVTLEEANKFVKDNNIQSLRELNIKYHDKYLLFQKVRKNIEFPYSVISWKGEEYTIEYFQNFIDENNIRSRHEFMVKYPKEYSCCVRKEYLPSLKFELDKSYIRYNIKERFKTVEDIHRYMSENNITMRKQLVSTEEGRAIHTHAENSGWRIIYPDSPKDCSEYDTLEKIQKFIDDNNILTASELHDNYPGIYGRLTRLGLLKKVHYAKFKDGMNRSALEIKIAKELDRLGIEYSEQKIFSDLKDKKHLRFDFLIESKKLMLEPGGTGHLASVGFSEGENFEIVKKHDEMKREYCKKNGYTILYLFVNDHRNLISKEEFERLVKEYPGECYTIDNFEFFINRILSL